MKITVNLDQMLACISLTVMLILLGIQWWLAIGLVSAISWVLDSYTSQ